MRNILCLFFLMVISGCAYALQVKNFSENDSVKVKISAAEITRIFVSGDRISSLRGVKGTYHYENDDNRGEIYLQPTQSYQEHPFSVLIETEKGKHLVLVLQPSSRTSDIIELQPNIKKPYKNKAQLVWGKRLMLIKQLHKQQRGFLRNNYNCKILYFINKTNHTLKMDEKFFLTDNTVALAISQRHLSPKQLLKVYQVVQYVK